MEDDNIINLFWERSEAAISELTLRYKKYCENIAYNILQNKEDVDECLNDAYMSLWNSIPPQKPVSLRAYLAKVIRNHSLNKYKSRKAQKRGSGEMEMIFDELEEGIPSGRGTESECERKLLAEDINEFVRTLPNEQQVVFLRRYWYSDSIHIIAERYSISESKVKSILYRCRGKLKTHLEQKGVIM